MSAILVGLAVLLLGLVFLALIPPKFDDRMPRDWRDREREK